MFNQFSQLDLNKSNYVVLRSLINTAYSSSQVKFNYSVQVFVAAFSKRKQVCPSNPEAANKIQHHGADNLWLTTKFR